MHSGINSSRKASPVADMAQGHPRDKLGQSNASGEFSASRMQRSNLISLEYGSSRMCYNKMAPRHVQERHAQGFVQVGVVSFNLARRPRPTRP